MHSKNNPLSQTASLLVLFGIFCALPERILAEETPAATGAAEAQDNSFSRPFFNNERTPVSTYSDSSQKNRVEEELKQPDYLETGDSFSIEGDEGDEAPAKVSTQTAVATARGNSARITRHLQDIRNQAKARTASTRPERLQRPRNYTLSKKSVER